jgi:hypothetical protein
MLGNKIIKKNKKAQVGETMTWIIATLVIIGTLLIFIYFSIALAKAKSADEGLVKTKAKELSKVDVNWVESKNEMGFARNSENKNKIEVWINDKQKEPDN